MGADDFIDEGEPETEPSPGVCAAVAACEALCELVPVGRVEALPGVSDAEENLVSDSARADLDDPPGVGVGDGVVDQRQYRPPQRGRSTEDMQ